MPSSQNYVDGLEFDCSKLMEVALTVVEVAQFLPMFFVVFLLKNTKYFRKNGREKRGARAHGKNVTGAGRISVENLWTCLDMGALFVERCQTTLSHSPSSS